MPTMNLVSFDLATLIADASVSEPFTTALTIGVNLFGNEFGHLNGAEIDKQILIVDTEGIDSDLKQLYEQPSFQIIARGGKDDDQLSLYEQLREIHEYLIQLPESVQINGCGYAGFEPVGNIVPLGRDDNKRFMYSVNYYTYRNTFGA